MRPWRLYLVSLSAVLPAVFCAASLSLSPASFAAEVSTADSKTGSERVETVVSSKDGGAPSTSANPYETATTKKKAEVKQAQKADIKQKESDSEEPPIHGFHPIKKMLRPVVQLERNSVELHKQIIRLQGPIAGLQQPMLGLQGKMNQVDQRMVGMQKTIGGMQGKVGEAAEGMSNVNRQMTGVRSDLAEMQKDITDLRKPLTDLHGPLSNVAQPLKDVYQQLADMKALLGAVLIAIVIAAIAIAIGTPIAAVWIYKNRSKFFPHMNERDFPVAKSSEKEPAGRV